MSNNIIVKSTDGKEIVYDINNITEIDVKNGDYVQVVEKLSSLQLEIDGSNLVITFPNDQVLIINNIIDLITNNGVEKNSLISESFDLTFISFIDDNQEIIQVSFFEKMLELIEASASSSIDENSLTNLEDLFTVVEPSVDFNENVNDIPRNRSNFSQTLFEENNVQEFDEEDEISSNRDFNLNVSNISDIREDVESEGDTSSNLVSQNVGNTTPVVATVTSNLDVQYSLDGNDAEKFEIIGNEIRIKAGARFDYEVSRSADIQVVATDSEGNTVRKDVSFNILDYHEEVISSSSRNIRGGSEDDVIEIKEGPSHRKSQTIRGGDGEDTVVFEGNREEYTIAYDENRNRNVITNVQTNEVQYIYDDVENIEFANETVNISNGTYDNDVVTGTTGNDRVSTGTGDDEINSGTGNDRINSGSGDDVVNAGTGNDRVDAGSGNDVIDGGTGRNDIRAGDGDDRVIINEGDGRTNYDVVRGGDGEDTVVFEGNREEYTIAYDENRNRNVITNVQTNEVQYIYDDVENIEFANETVNISNGTYDNDVVTGTTGNDRVSTGTGDDEINSGTGNDRINSGSGDDVVNAGTGNDRVDAGSGNDVIDGGTGRNDIRAGDGDDRVIINEGDGRTNYDVVRGGDGEDTVVFEGNREEYTIAYDENRNRNVITNVQTNEVQYIYDDVENIEFANETVNISNGTYDNDVVTGTTGNDRVSTGTGDDEINSGTGNDRINSGSGDDVVNAGTGNDRVDAGSGNDVIDGGTGRNDIRAGDGDDRVIINEGDGRTNYDVVRGGDGEDTVVFEGNREEYTIAYDENRNRNVITNVQTNEVQYIYDDVENIEFADSEINFTVDDSFIHFDDVEVDKVKRINIENNQLDNITLDTEDIIKMKDDDKILQIIGENGDQIGLSNDNGNTTWQKTGEKVQTDDKTFEQWTDDNVTIYIDEDITVTDI